MPASGRFGAVVCAMATPFDADGALDVEGAATLAAWLVDPGNAANSELYLQVEQGLMPQTGGPLTAAQQKQIHDWICDGAPND